MRDSNHKNRMKKRQAATSATSPERRKFGGNVASEKCGCTISGFGTPEQPWKIAYCQEHQDALEEFRRKVD